MGLINGIVLILLGALCVPSLIAKKNANAMELLEKVTPYQGVFGLIVFAWGVWGIISAVLTIGWLGSWPLWWATRLAGNLLNALGGIILGFAMIQKLLLSKLPQEAQGKAVELREKLLAYQGTIGIWAIIVGLWVLLYELVLQGLFHI